MSITRLQQARQMYAMGQRVSKTLDGSRPGYRGRTDANTMSGSGYGAGSSSGGKTGEGGGGRPNMRDVAGPTTTTTSKPDTKPDNKTDARSNYISTMYKNMPTPTVTIGVDKFDNPIEFKTTYKDKFAREQMLDALNKKGISSFDPRVTKKGINFLDPNNLVTNFAPKQKKFGIMDLIMIAASGGLLGPKIATGAKMFNTAKNVSKLAETIGLTDTNVLDSFTSNFSDKFSGFNKGKKSTSKNNTTINNGGNGGGEGLASLENQAGGYDEYILLLQKLQSGNISDSERNRFNVLKNMLGI